jgi:hypothetical protein
MPAANKVDAIETLGGPPAALPIRMNSAEIFPQGIPNARKRKTSFLNVGLQQAVALPSEMLDNSNLTTGSSAALAGGSHHEVVAPDSPDEGRSSAEAPKLAHRINVKDKNPAILEMLPDPAKHLLPSGEMDHVINRVEQANNRIELLGQTKPRHVLSEKVAVRDPLARTLEHAMREVDAPNLPIAWKSSQDRPRPAREIEHPRRLRPVLRDPSPHQRGHGSSVACADIVNRR